ncbi:S26 family signal peptidase [Paracoccus methylovorus]|uniref:S26 family signal peptidase n=1 Tax=Paracoccus methylovorus TaxID=2812658 RepID=A0ABX7JR70_9RHOB|nr:S26 family signal peptidase [Paracoccus methylovorus]QRZ15976.1 S26 family signal peptidase [Paracoccus methylovorus]
MCRRRYLAVTGLAVLQIGSISATNITPRLIWNASASVPLGLYVLRPAGDLTVGDLVAVDPPESLAGFITERGYTAVGVPLLKHVAALAGQRVCRSGSTITIDETSVSEALPQDRLGRDLPVWQGCRILMPGEVFLLNAGIPDSLDGRYFGPLPAHSVIGRAIPLWTDDALSDRAPAGAEVAPPSH